MQEPLFFIEVHWRNFHKPPTAVGKGTNGLTYEQMLDYLRGFYDTAMVEEILMIKISLNLLINTQAPAYEPEKFEIGFHRQMAVLEIELGNINDQ